MLTKIYQGLGICAIGLYTMTTFLGWEFGKTKLDSKQPTQSRSSSGRSGGGFFFFGGSGGGGGFGGGK